MAKLNRIRVHAEDGCVDSVGGFRYEREEASIRPDTLCRFKVQTSDGENLELEFEWHELQRLLRIIKFS